MPKSALSLLVLTAIATLSLAALPALAGEKVLSTVDGWRIILNLNDDNSFNRCLVESTQDGNMLRVSNGGGMDFSLSVPASGHKNGDDGTIGLDGNQPEFFGFSANKYRAWTGISWETEQAMEASRMLEVWVGNAQMRWRMKGFGDAVGYMTDCVNQYKS